MEKVHSIDCMRAIAAFLVVCIHIPFYGMGGSIAIAISYTTEQVDSSYYNSSITNYQFY